jgi:hypothetical protein
MSIGIASFFGKMFGTEKAVNTMIEQVGKAADALYYTKEEKAQDGAKDTTELRSMLVDWMKNTEGQNLARRFIATVVTSTWAISKLSAVGTAIVATWVKEPVAWTNSSKLIGEFADQTTGAMMLILGFYFAAPHLGAIVATAMDRFSGKK